jgi:hypothetical protein
VGHGDALVALDWSLGVAWVANDGGAERAAEQELRRCYGPVVLVEEMEIGLLSELLWVVVVLLMHWIRVRRWWWWLSTVARRRGRGPVRAERRKKKVLWLVVLG